MKKKKKSINEAKIIEMLASTGFIFPRNEVELERFEILFANNDFSLTGREIDPDVILSRNRSRSRTIKLMEARNYLADDLRLIAKRDEDSINVEIEKLLEKPNKKKNSDAE